MYPNGVPDAISQPDFKGFVASSQQFGFNKVRFKNLDPTAVRAEVEVVKIPWTFTLIGPPPSGPLIDPYYVWNKILLAYTRCALSHDTDKLVAISAAAKQIESMAKDVYLAGLWRRHLPYHLLWYTDPHKQERCRPEKFCAPSWSWASIKAPIEPYVYIRPDHPTMIQILEANVQTETTDLMGKVSGGLLQLQGWLKTFAIVKENANFRVRSSTGSGQNLALAHFDENQDCDGYELCLLPIVSLGPWLQCESLGLMLVETGKRDEYRRVGRFRAEGDGAKVFRRPTYPIRDSVEVPIDHDISSSGSHRIPSTRALDIRSRDWSFGKWGKKHNKNGWTESVITIV